ncbi:FHA domain-containing protein [Cryobacterium psychrophilum]|uniref:FHA domain-containing protein n=1 Tax=Cryobacterium psychrophilum TaxID=41988 RepID=A0A4Y8KL65_9MICO|nr:FHA domain-containing protein [Cryobacterium psychrophilum]TDW29153.1 FHA domain-containing protein [Cryobacterium psychrophilum]TFD77815.1 FHA domain-containing protein [Cryobacterium psychrophilum]
MNVGRVGCALWPGSAPEWTFIVGSDLLVALPVATPAHLLETLHGRAERSGATVDDVLALIPQGGDEAVDSFAVVIPGEPTDADGVRVSVVVRGSVVVDVFSIGGSRRISDGGASPWWSGDFVSVTGIAIGSPGIARVSPAELESGQTIGPGAISGSALFWSAEFSSAQFSSVQSSSAQTVGRAADPQHRDAPMNPPPPSSTAQPGDGFDDTVLRAPWSASPITANVAPLPAEDTILRVPGASARGVAPARENSGHPAPEQADVPLERYGFRLPDGTERRLDTVYLLGRHPQPTRVGAGGASRLITIASRTSAVSATHLEIRQDGDSVVVTDVGSTNGTMVFPARGRRQRLRAGQSVAVRPGTRVDIGDGNIIEVLR